MAKKAKAKRRVIGILEVKRDGSGQYWGRYIVCHQSSKSWWRLSKEYEAYTKVSDHLKPGGGPLKMRLVRA